MEQLLGLQGCPTLKGKYKTLSFEPKFENLPLDLAVGNKGVAMTHVCEGKIDIVVLAGAYHIYTSCVSSML